MEQGGARVLVIDDDAVVVVAVSDLLEEHGYRVFTLCSPIGATQVIVREQIDIAVIDVNMPEMQGDSVVRLFRTWDRLKDLPIVMLSGVESAKLEQLRREMPDILVVRKSAMQHALVKTIEGALSTARSLRPQQQNDVPVRAVEMNVHQAYLDDLAQAVQLIGAIWKELLRRDLSRRSQAIQALEALTRRSQLLNLETVGALLQGVNGVITAVEPGWRPTGRALRGIDDALSALSQLQTSRTRDFPVAPAFLILELVAIAAELREAAQQFR